MSLDASLAQLPLEELQLRLAAHAIERPLSSDPGFAKWLEIRDQIKFHRDLKAGEARIGWKDTSTGEVAPPPQVPAFGRSADPKPKTTPAPISVPPPSVKQPETPMGSKLKKDMTEEELEAKRAYQWIKIEPVDLSTGLGWLLSGLDITKAHEKLNFSSVI